MKLPVSSWKRTLKTLGLKLVSDSKLVHARRRLSRRKQQLAVRTSQGYEILEPKQLLAADGMISVVDSLFDRSFQYSESGQSENNYSLDDSRWARGTAFSDDGRLQFVVDAGRRVYVYDTNSQSQVGGWSIGAVASPQGIAVDGNDILIVDQWRDRVYRFENGVDFRSGEHASDSNFRLKSGNHRPSGISTDGENIWVVDRGNDRVYVYGADGQRRGNWRLDGANRRPTGIAYDPDSNGIWVVDEQDNRAYFYEDGQSYVSGRRDANLSFHLRFYNWYAQGIAKAPSFDAAPAAPTISGITEDTGVNSSDGRTSDINLLISGTADPDTTVTVTSSNGSLGSAVTDSNGQWTVDATAIGFSDGAYLLTAVASDDNGSSNPSNAFELTIDTVAPVAPIVLFVDQDTGRSDSDGITFDNSLTISGTSEPGAYIEILNETGASLGQAQSNNQGEWSVVFTNTLNDSNYGLTAIAADDAGNQSGPSNVFAITIDTLGPVQPVIVSIDDDTGRSETDAITRSANQMLTGSAEPNSNLQVLVDGIATATTTVADNGTWTASVVLPEGAVIITAIANDTAGNISPTSDPFQVVVDLSEPDAPVLTAIDEDTNLADGVTSDNSLFVSGTAEPFAIVRVNETSLGVLGETTADTDGEWSLEVAQTLVDNVYEFTAFSEDVAGNLSESSLEFQVTIDTRAPSTPSIVIVDQDSANSSDGITSDATLIFSGFAESGSEVVLSNPTLGEIGRATTDAGGIWTVDNTANSIADGVYQLTAVSTDLAGNESNSSSIFSLTIDTLSPLAPAISSIEADTGLGAEGVTSDNTLVFRGLGEADTTVTLSEDNLGEVGTALVQPDGTWIIDATGSPLADGTYHFAATLTDIAGNLSSTSAVFEVVVDTENPETPSIVRIDDDTGNSSDDSVTSDTTLVFTGMGPSNSTIFVMEQTAGLIGSSSTNALGVWTLDLSGEPFQDGQFEFTAVAEDIAGNLSPPSSALVVRIDTLAPATPSIDLLSVDTGEDDGDGVTSDSTPTIEGSAEPFSNISIVDSLIGEIATTVTNSSGDWQIPFETALVDGSYSLVAIATDVAGNVSAMSDTFFLTIDTMSPAVPAILSVSDDTGISSTDQVTADSTLSIFGIATPTGTLTLAESSWGFEQSVVVPADGNWSIDVSQPLADGSYLFFATVSDLAGNVSNSSASFLVVVDTSAPSTPTLALASESDTGVIGDGETSAAIVRLVGLTEPDARVSLQETSMTTTADASGAFSFEDVSLVDGGNTFTVVASDLAGNNASFTTTFTKTTDVETTPVVTAGLLNDTGSSNRDTVTSDPTITGSVSHGSTFLAEFMLGFSGPNGFVEIRQDITSLVNAAGDFEINQTFLDQMFDNGAMAFGAYEFTVIATDVTNSDNFSFHFGELFFVPSGSDNPPIAVGIGLQNDTGSIATDRMSTDPTLVGFVDTDSLDKVEFFFDSAGPDSFADISDLVDANGDFVIDQPLMESILGGPLQNQRHDYHIVARDTDGNLAFKYSFFGFLESDEDDISPPELTVGLLDDSGPSNADGITNDISVAGTAIDESGVDLSVFIFSLDTFSEFGGDVSDLLDANGNFLITQDRMELLAGSPLADGNYEISVLAEDRYTRTNRTIIVQLDTAVASPPVITSIATDSGLSDSDGITNDSTLIINGVADAHAAVEVFENQLGSLGTTTSDANGQWQFELSGPGLIDGLYEFTSIAQSQSGDTSDPSNSYQVTLDTDSPLRATLNLDPAFDSGATGDRYTTIDLVDLVGNTTPGASVQLMHDGQEVVADADGQFRFSNVSLLVGDHVYEVRTSDVAGNLQITRQRITYDQPVILNDSQFVNQASRTVSIDSPTVGSKTIRFKLDATFGSATNFEDSFAVYVVDPDNPSTTLVDRGTNGTAAFSMIGDQFGFRAGAVRYDGVFVEVDVTSVATAEVMLIFQLLNNDSDSDTSISVSQLGVYVDENAVASPVGNALLELAPASTFDVSSLSASGNLGVEFDNVRYDSESQELTAAVRVRNNGAGDLRRAIAVVFDDLPADVTMQNASGNDSGGAPYVSFAGAIPLSGLLAGQSSDFVYVRFFAPTESPFLNPVIALDAGAPATPVIDVVPDLNLMPGEVLEVQLSASSDDEFYFTMNNDGSLPDMTLVGDGKLTIAPKPGQAGTYSFEVFATDGIRTTSETIVLNVVDDTDTTSRVSGFVMDTFSNPLAGIPVELGGVEVLTASDGSFELSFVGGVPNDALKVHGEAFGGPEVYPFVAEKLPLLFGHDAYDNINNVVARPIYLPALDVANGVPIDPAVDVTVTTTTIPGASVFVSAGSLESQNGGMFTGELSITEVPAEFTPAALPSDLFPDLVVTIQPGEMVFTTPAPLNLPNLSGFPAGTEMTLWSINPVTGLFDDVGLGVVSADGAVVETVSGGIRNSSWHLFTPAPVDPVDASENPNNEDKECEDCSAQSYPNIVESDFEYAAPENQANVSHFRDDAPATTPRRRYQSSNPSGESTHQPLFNDRLRDSAGPESSVEIDGGNNVAGETSVSLHSGAIHKTHSIEAYQSLGQWRGIELHYDSERADARPIISIGAEGFLPQNENTLVAKVQIKRGQMTMTVPGFAGSAPGLTGGEHFFAIPLGSQSFDVSIQADMNQLPSGVYTYESTTRITRGAPFTGTSRTTSDRLIHVNSADSEFGIGWGLSGLTRLIENPDGSVLMVNGNGSELLFSAPVSVGEPYASPAGDFSTLIKLPNGRFQRTYTDQTVESFSDSHKLTRTTDRHGNETQFAYNATDKLESITDPVGQITTMRYVDGRVAEIEDPAGRITTLSYLNGNLVGIQDPESSTKTYSYDSASRLVGEVNKLGNSEQLNVGFSGRIESIIRQDGSTINYSPVQTANLFRPELTSTPDHVAVSAIGYRSKAVVQTSDANGNVKQVELDKAGQLLNSNDGEGAMPTVERAANNLVQQIIDGRGNVTLLEYDNRGNVISIADEVARQNRQEVGFESSVQSVTTLDANGDGLLDIAVALPTLDAVSIAFGNGDGTFESPETFPAGIAPRNIEAIDLNGDGFEDLVVTSQVDQRATILFNDEFGFFDIGLSVAVADPTNIAFADLNGDGQQDIVIGGRRTFSTLMNNGDDTFDKVTTDTLPNTGANRVSVGDFDGNGNPDVVVGSPDLLLFKNQLEIYAGNGNGTFDYLSQVDVQGGTDENVDWFLSGVSVADVDGDGSLDLMAATPFTNEAISNNVGVSYGNGDGTFTPAIGFANGTTARSIQTGDFNGDGLLDFVSANQEAGSAAVTYGAEGRTLGTTAEFVADSGSLEAVVGDFDGDGVDDFAVANFDAENVTVHFPNSNRKQFEYDPVFNQLSKTIDELGRVVLYDIDPANGNTRSITQVVGEVGGPDDITTSMTYTPQGLLETVTDALGRVTRHDYNVLGLLERVTFAVGTAVEAFVEYGYDAVGNRTSMTDELGHRTEYVFDALNRVTQIVEEDPDAAGPLTSPTTVNAYDEHGNLTQITDAEGKITELVYDQLHRVIEVVDADSESIHYEYDLAGNMSAKIDRLGRRTEFFYDQRNRLIETINAVGGKSRQVYDADNNLIAKIDENGVRIEYGHDSRNRITSTTNGLGGTVNYEYDTVDNAIAIIDEIGRRVEMSYDEINRLVETRRPDPDRDGPEITPVTTSVYDVASNLVSITDALGNTTTNEFDDRDRVISVTEADPDGAGPLSSPIVMFVYDDANRLISSTDPLGRQVSFVFDNLNRLVQETHPDPDGIGPDSTPIVRHTYNAVDNRTSTTDALGNVSTFAYDDLHRQVLTTAPDPDNAGPLLAPTFVSTYDAEGQVIAQMDPLGRATNYEYDDLGRVIRTTLPDPDGAGPGTSPVTIYSYDAVGNEISMVDALGNETIRIYDDNYRLIKLVEADPDGMGQDGNPISRYRYDAAHQLTSVTDAIDRTKRFVFDDLGRLVREFFPNADGQGGPSSVNTYAYDLVGNQTAVTDGLGNTTQYVFDGLYRLIETIEEDPDGTGPESSPRTVRTYDAASQLLSLSDPLGRKSEFVYDDLGRVVQQTLPDPDGAGPSGSPTMFFQFDLIGNELSMTDALGNVTRYTYDNLYRQIQVVEADPDGVGPEQTPVTNYEFDVASQMIAMTDALGRVTTIEYDDLGREIKVIKPDPDGTGPSTAPETTFAFDNMNNRLATTDANGNTTRFEYDDLHRLISIVQADPDDAGPQTSPTTTFDYDLADQMTSTVDPLGRRSTSEYDHLGRVVRRTMPDPDAAGPLASPEMTYVYDVVGNQLAMTDAVGNVTQYEYDRLYRRIQITEADPDGAGPLQNPVSRYAYDIAGQLRISSDELNRATTYVYDDLGRVVSTSQPDPDGAGPLASPETVYTYDLMNNRLSSVDPNGFEVAYVYDNLYRLVRETGEDLDGAGPLDRPSTEYTYDLMDNRLSLTDSSNNRTDYSYDNLDRMFEESIDLGAGNTVTRQYEYDLEDNLIRKTDRNGRVTEYGLDRLYRTVEERWLDGLDNIVNTIQFDFDEAGQLLGAEDLSAGSRYDYDYDDLGRVIQSTINNGGPEVSFASSFDAQSRKLQRSAIIAGVADFSNDYRYDGLNRLIAIDQSGFGVTGKRFEFDYNAADQFETVRRFDGLSSEAVSLVMSSSFGYDGIGRLSHLMHTSQSASIADYHYALDAGSRITEIVHSIDGASQFTYDNENQVTAATHAVQVDESYQFDEEGNRANAGYTTGFYNRLTSDGLFNYEYDNEGNRVKRTSTATGAVTEFEWDHRNRLIRVIDRASDGGAATQEVSHRYDVFNRWISKSVDADGAGGLASETTRYEYDGNQIVLTITEAGDVVNRYVWGPGIDMLLADEHVGDQVYWTAGDHLGSVRDIVDASGSVVNHIVYDSFGNITNETDAGLDLLFGYTGKAFETSTGMQNNLNRWYDATVGRWVNEDPISFTAGDTNLYRYVGNNALNSIDPDGLMDFWNTPLGRGLSRIHHQPLESARVFVNPVKRRFEKSSAGRFGLELGETTLDLVGTGMNALGNVQPYLFEKVGPTVGELTALKYAEATGQADLARRVQENSRFNQTRDLQRFIAANGTQATRDYLKTALLYADISAHVYEGKRGESVHHFELLERFDGTNSSQKTLRVSGFQSALYVNPKTKQFILAFEGTNPELVGGIDGFRDICQDAKQGFGRRTEQYEMAISLAGELKKTYGDSLTLTGHSLGGGLATAASLVHNIPAFVVDPAGVHAKTIGRHGADFSRANELVYGARLYGEFLTTFVNTAPGAAPTQGNILTIPASKFHEPFGAHSGTLVSNYIRDLLEIPRPPAE